MSHLSEDEVEQVKDILEKLDPGFLPQPIFNEVSRLVTTSIIEIVPLRQSGHEIEMLLLRRDSNDPIWPNQWHTPGTILRATDSIDSAVTRIMQNELGDIRSSAPFFAANILHHSGRGMEAAQVHWIEVLGESEIGKFYSINNLPNDLVNTQMDFIPTAIKSYKHYLRER